MCSHCGTVRGNATPTVGSPTSSQICASHSAGPPTTTTSTPLRRSPFTRHSLARESNSTSRLHGPKNCIEPARTVKHRRLAQLYSMAAQCYAAGRSGGAVRYADAALGIIESGHFDAIPYEGEAWLGGAEAVTRYRQTRQAVSGPVGGLAHPALEGCRSAARQSPNTKHHLHRTRGRTCRFGAGAEDTPVGDPHRRRTGQHMTNAELSEYALDQIDRAREFLGHKETQEPPESWRFLGVVATLLVNWSVVDHASARLGYPSRAFCVGGR